MMKNSENREKELIEKYTEYVSKGRETYSKEIIEILVELSSIYEKNFSEPVSIEDPTIF